MVVVNHYSQTNGEVLASVQQPVSHVSRRLAGFSFRCQLLIGRFIITVSSRSTLHRPVITSMILSCIYLTRNTLPPRNIRLRLQISALQPHTSNAHHLLRSSPPTLITSYAHHPQPPRDARKAAKTPFVLTRPVYLLHFE